MIGPGSLPRLGPTSALASLRRRTVLERRARRIRRGAATRPVPGRADGEDASDHPTLEALPQHELPIATILERRPTAASVAAGLRTWIAARWSWLRPRTIPVAVAVLSMVGMLRAVDYLAHPPEGSSLVGKAYTAHADPAR